MQNTRALTYNNGSSLWQRVRLYVSRVDRGFVFGVIMFGALLAFELFNYSTTDFALTDFLGSVTFVSLRWATILAVAFCGMDFAGIARLFTPERTREERTEIWYLLGAWFLAATMNAVLTWWGVSVALLQHQSLGNEILSRQQLLKIVPVFVAVLVWLIRILLIGTFSMAGDRFFSLADASGRYAARAAARPVRLIGSDSDYDRRPLAASSVSPDMRRPVAQGVPLRPVTPVMPTVRPAPKPSVGSNGARPLAVQSASASGHSDIE
jgi:hypothetical protein